VKEAGEHRPVLLEEAVEAMNIQPQGCYIDGTFGRGGHSGEILARLGSAGCLIALDRDATAIAHGRERFAGDARLHLYGKPFSTMAEVAREQGVAGQVQGVLLDLGVSSPQLDDPARGFSFQRAGPLDMRMDRHTGPTAAQWLGEASEEEIARVLWEYGEERFSRRIARAIVRQRQQRPLQTTTELAWLVASVLPRRERHKHPATRTFQAIRIHVNRELEELRKGLEQALEILAAGGRLVVISFHSLEDRLVKRFFREHARGPQLPRGVPVRGDEMEAGALKLVGRAIRASGEEVRRNPRARSAILRVAERRG
jgi:16S rRNA (cytosine1402-N4)-methyltransferase